MNFDENLECTLGSRAESLDKIISDLRKRRDDLSNELSIIRYQECGGNLNIARARRAEVGWIFNEVYGIKIEDSDMYDSPKVVNHES